MTLESITPRIAILGAGPAGLALALRLLQSTGSDYEVHIFERSHEVGGLATSFEFQGLVFDNAKKELVPSKWQSKVKDYISKTRKLNKGKKRMGDRIEM